jgi:hypothetical protein
MQHLAGSLRSPGVAAAVAFVGDQAAQIVAHCKELGSSLLEYRHKCSRDRGRPDSCYDDDSWIITAKHTGNGLGRWRQDCHHFCFIPLSKA